MRLRRRSTDDPSAASAPSPIFSLSKHFPGRGGVLSLGRDISRADVFGFSGTDGSQAAGPPSGGPRFEQRPGLHWMPSISDGWCSVAARRCAPSRPVAWRVPLRAPRLKLALAANDLGQFDQWMQTAYADYRMRQESSGLKRSLAGLRDVERDREERSRGRAPPSRTRCGCARSPRGSPGAAAPCSAVDRKPGCRSHRNAPSQDQCLFRLRAPSRRLFWVGILRAVSGSGGGPMVGRTRSSH